MKQVVSINLILFSLVLLSSCKKESHRSNCNFTHAKVLRYDCDRVILQVLDNSINGDASWTDIVNGNTYSNVVSYHNTCAFAAAAGNTVTDIYIEGAVITNDPATDANCLQCLAVSPDPPVTKINAAGFSPVPCNDDDQ